jgi:peroxiredoxin
MRSIINLLFIFILLGTITVNGFTQIPTSADSVKPMAVGSILPLINLQDINGKTVGTPEVFNQPVVMIVYRGGWCPYCNKQLAGLEPMEKDIIAMGFRIVAISPDAPEQLKTTIEKQKLSYTLLSDNKAELIMAMGLAFKAPVRYNDMLLKVSEGGNTQSILPVPAVYIFHKNRKVLYAYTDADYKVRLDEKELMEQLVSYIEN